MSNRTCTIDECARPHVAKGLCSTHYERKRTGANLSAPVRRQFSTPAEAFEARTMPVPEAGCLLWTGSVNAGGYGYLWVDGRDVLAHRYAWEQERGGIPSGMHVDHLCWARSCCNVDHLRLATNAQNQQNRSGATRNSKSGIRGVTWHKQNQKWRVQVQVAGKNHHGGLFVDKEEAARAAEELRERLMPYTQN